MEKLFRNLPTDLQWHVLQNFVGTHVVRNGKLLRKLTYYTAHDGSLMRQVGNESLLVVNGMKQRRRPHDWSYDKDENIRYHIRLRDLPTIRFYEDNISGDTIYGYNKMYEGIYPVWELHFPTYKVADELVLPSFVKKVYPSYPYTNKKLQRL